jgi:Sec-independent protein secretion pathway component TatC
MKTLLQFPPSLGVLELALVALAAVAVFVLLVRRRAHVRWWIAGLVSALVAALLTPADFLSTVVLGVVLFGMFFFGARFGSMKKSSIG